jgi:hypothetical protein
MELQAVDCLVDLLVLSVEDDADQVLLIIGELGDFCEVLVFSLRRKRGLV